MWGLLGRLPLSWLGWHQRLSRWRFDGLIKPMAARFWMSFNLDCRPRTRPVCCMSGVLIPSRVTAKPGKGCMPIPMGPKPPVLGMPLGLAALPHSAHA